MEWYHPIVSARQQKKYERVRHPPIALVGTAAGSVIGCEKELGIGNF
jgi:hypothetical protein